MRNLSEIKILFVEDDIDTQENIKILLEDEVGALYQAYNGKEALEIYHEKKPDIIITDIKMPLLDGLEMAKKIREIDTIQPIIVVSAFDDKDLLLEAINIGIDQFVTKPIDLDTLMKKITKLEKKIYEKKTINKLLEYKDKKLYDMVYKDHLTDAYNRGFFEIIFNKIIKRTKQIGYLTALFFIDLDDFKSINDTYGHKAGDLILKKVVDNIKQIMRDTDILCRLGGDEFMLIAENIKDMQKVQALAQRISKVANFTIKYKQYNIKVSCSIGISLCLSTMQTKQCIV